MADPEKRQHHDYKNVDPRLQTANQAGASFLLPDQPPRHSTFLTYPAFSSPPHTALGIDCLRLRHAWSPGSSSMGRWRRRRRSLRRHSNQSWRHAGESSGSRWGRQHRHYLSQRGWGWGWGWGKFFHGRGRQRRQWGNWRRRHPRSRWLWRGRRQHDDNGKHLVPFRH